MMRFAINVSIPLPVIATIAVFVLGLAATS
jgi:hypothetical protein